MTTADLRLALARRAQLWTLMGHYICPVRELAPEKRQLVDSLSAERRALTAEIVAAIAERGGCFLDGEVTWWVNEEGTGLARDDHSCSNFQKSYIRLSPARVRHLEELNRQRFGRQAS